MLDSKKVGPAESRMAETKVCAEHALVFIVFITPNTQRRQGLAAQRGTMAAALFCIA